MTSIFESLDFFNSTYSYHYSEEELYNQIAHFLQHLQQCLHLYCESNLLDQLITVLNDFVNKWFDDQSKFISLHDFDIVLTKIFSSNEFATIQSTKSSLQEQEMLKVSKKQKRVERQALKNAKRVKSKILKIEQTAKSTSKLQNIDIFDSTLTCKNRRFDEVTNFLQHFQQCQHQYRESDLLFLLSLCLYDFAFDIWFNKQDIMKSASLCEWIEILRIDFAAVAFAKSKVNCSKIICMRCDSSFNFKKKLREHVREQHAKKFINNSSLEIVAINSICEAMKKSTIVYSSTLQASHTFTTSSERIHEFEVVFEFSSKNSHLKILSIKLVCETMKRSIDSDSLAFLSASFAKSSEQIFESAALFETVISSTSSNLSIATINIASQSMKSASNHEALKFVKNSHLSINAVDLVCEIEKTLFASQKLFAKSQKSIFESAIASKTVTLLKRSNLSFFTFEIRSESTKKSTTCRHCNQTFKFKKVLRKHKREQHAKKSVNDSSLSTLTINLTCKVTKKSTITSTAKTSIITSAQKKIELTRQKVQKVEILKIKQRLNELRERRAQRETFETYKIKKKSTVICSSASLASSISSAQKHQKIDVQKLSIVNSRLSINTVKATSEFVKISSVNSSFSVSLTIQSEQLSESFTFSKEIISFKCSSLTSSTFKSVCESEKKSTIACSLSSQKSSFSSAKSRYLVTDTRTSLQLVSLKCSNLSIATLKIPSERAKSASLQRVACAWICKRCKQSFNFNNKLHEHLREHHARKFVTSENFDLRIFALESAYKIAKKSAVIDSFVSHVSSIFFATSRSQIFSTKIASRSISSSSSNLSIATHKTLSKSIKKLSIKCSFTSSLSSSRTFVQKHQEFHIQKSYLIMNDLSRMFIEKSKSFDLRSHQDRSYSSQSFDIRQFSQSCFSTASKKSYLIIENLFEMFDEKFKKKSLFQSQNNVFSRTFSNQMRIIAYFKFAINQKLSINQNSKSSNSKNLNQHMSAKFIRTNFNKCFEKSIFLSYKMSNIFYIKSKIFLQSKFSFTWFSLTFSSSFRFSSSDFHLCCICFDQFNFNNWLHKHLRASHQCHSSCQSMRVLN